MGWTEPNEFDPEGQLILAQLDEHRILCSSNSDYTNGVRSHHITPIVIGPDAGARRPPTVITKTCHRSLSQPADGSITVVLFVPHKLHDMFLIQHCLISVHSLPRRFRRRTQEIRDRGT